MATKAAAASWTALSAVIQRTLEPFFSSLRAINPVMMLDEIDKLGADFRGDPSAALLEVLDPEQNHTFRDHYLNVPLDLSQVLFLANANELEPIHPAFKDRMEIIYLNSYTLEEKLGIAEQHLIPKQLEKHGVTRQQLSIPRKALKAMATGRAHALDLKTWSKLGLQDVASQPFHAVVFSKAKTVAESKLGFGRGNASILRRDGHRCQYHRECSNVSCRRTSLCPRNRGNKSGGFGYRSLSSGGGRNCSFERHGKCRPGYQVLK